MNQAERDRLVTLKKAKKRLITQAEAARELGVSVRQVKRLLRALKKRGDRAVVHGLRGRPSPHRLPEAMKQEVIQILSEPVYAGFGPTLAAEYLSNKHGLSVSKETLRHWMMEARLWRGRKRKPEEVHVRRARPSPSPMPPADNCKSRIRIAGQNCARRSSHSLTQSLRSRDFTRMISRQQKTLAALNRRGSQPITPEPVPSPRLWASAWARPRADEITLTRTPKIQPLKGTFLLCWIRGHFHFALTSAAFPGCRRNTSPCILHQSREPKTGVEPTVPSCRVRSRPLSRLFSSSSVSAFPRFRLRTSSSSCAGTGGCAIRNSAILPSRLKPVTATEKTTVGISPFLVSDIGIR
jgi:transposase